MHIRILKYKFTNDVKANLFLSFIKSEMYDLYKSIYNQTYNLMG